MNEEPIFEVFNREKTKYYKIYENGNIEGFGDATIIINRIVTRMNYYYALGCKSLSLSSPKMVDKCLVCDEECTVINSNDKDCKNLKEVVSTFKEAMKQHMNELCEKIDNYLKKIGMEDR